VQLLQLRPLQTLLLALLLLPPLLRHMLLAPLLLLLLLLRTCMVPVQLHPDWLSGAKCALERQRGGGAILKVRGSEVDPELSLLGLQ
jgi:hypothetical protein